MSKPLGAQLFTLICTLQLEDTLRSHTGACLIPVFLGGKGGEHYRIATCVGSRYV